MAGAEDAATACLLLAERYLQTVGLTRREVLLPQYQPPEFQCNILSHMSPLYLLSTSCPSLFELPLWWADPTAASVEDGYVPFTGNWNPSKLRPVRHWAFHWTTLSSPLPASLRGLLTRIQPEHAAFFLHLAFDLRTTSQAQQSTQDTPTGSLCCSPIDS